MPAASAMMDPRGGRPLARMRPLVALLIVVVTLQALFTAAVRLYVVPKLTPDVHMHSGLQLTTDSEYFHEEATVLSHQLRQQGWTALGEDVDIGLLHVKIIASIYYAAGHDSPYAVYAVNVLAAALSACLLFAFGRGMGLSPWVAAAGAGLLVTGPMFLFVHSELLREPFIINSFLTFTVGVWGLIRIPDGVYRARVGIVGGAVPCALGFAAVSLFRPYLMLPMLLAMTLIFVLCVVLPIAARSGRRVCVTQGLALAGTLFGLTFGFVIPQMNRVRQYSELGASEAKIREVKSSTEEAWRRLRKKIDAFAPDARSKADVPPSLSHDDIMFAGVCTVKWQPSPFVPSALNRKAESLACAREGHLLFCNPDLVGYKADRHCDQTMFQSVGDIVRHVPSAVIWSVGVPYPNMWLDGFGSAGSGLRRAGYVVDGIVSYALLPGLLGLFWHWRRRPDLVALTTGLLVIHLIYGLGVPSQFILARMRLAMYLPLLMLAMYGWALMLRLCLPARRYPVWCAPALS